MRISAVPAGLRLLACVGVLATALSADTAVAQDGKARPLTTEAEKKAATDEAMVRICQMIADTLKQRGAPPDPDCQNILAVDRHKSDRKSMKRYCAGKTAGADLCEIAKTTADSLSKELPKRIDRQSSLTEVSAKGKALTLVYTFNVRSSQFRGFYTSMFQSKAETTESLSGHMRQRLCSNDALRRLINSGLQMTSIYMSQDRQLMGSAEVSAC